MTDADVAKRICLPVRSYRSYGVFRISRRGLSLSAQENGGTRGLIQNRAVRTPDLWSISYESWYQRDV